MSDDKKKDAADFTFGDVKASVIESLSKKIADDVEAQLIGLPEDKDDLVSKADSALAGLATGGLLNEKQAERLTVYLSDILNAPPVYGPIQQTGEPCDHCHQPRGNVTHGGSSGRTFCSRGCLDNWTLENEKDRLYEEDRSNRWLVQDLEGRPAYRHDINRSLWSIAFGPLWRQDVFDFAYDNFETDVFLVRPYYWGDCTCGHDERVQDWDRANEHTVGCYHTTAEDIPWEFRDEDKRRKLDAQIQALCEQHGIPWNDGIGSRSHCTCDHDAKWQAFCAEHAHADDCQLELPNFVYKPTGFELRWYKYPLRGTTVSQKLASYEVLCEMVAHCISSLKKKQSSNDC